VPNSDITVFTRLALRHHVTFYDQITCGASTHLLEKAGDESFWTKELFLDELSNLIPHLELEKYDILGSSWGGMLGSRFAPRKPKGLRKLALANSLADMKIQYQSTDQYCLELLKDVQAALREHEEAGTTSSKEYNDAYGAFLRRHICKASPLPRNCLKRLRNGIKIGHWHWQ
jgi:pimeloyl-ACP methyl ester carboxylesterase